MWQCDPDACDWCLENDGAIVEAGDAFPNGATSPDDSHRFCRCTATELSVPDDVSTDDLSAADIAGLLALYAVGSLASRHARDVAAQRERERQQQQQDASDLIAAYFDEGDE